MSRIGNPRKGFSVVAYNAQKRRRQKSDAEIEFRELIHQVAELPTTGETPGAARDELLDQIIGASRQWWQRERPTLG